MVNVGENKGDGKRGRESNHVSELKSRKAENINGAYTTENASIASNLILKSLLGS